MFSCVKFFIYKQYLNFHCLQVLHAKQPLIVYFPDSSQWLSRAVPKSDRKDFVSKVQEIFDGLSGPVVLICGQNKIESGSKEKEKFVSVKDSFHGIPIHPVLSLHVYEFVANFLTAI